MKIGLVNDMPLALEALRRALAVAPQHEVVWSAGSGAEAVVLCAKLTPDLVLMDLIMPGMDGVEATRQIMAATPCTILIVTASVDTNASRVFEAMGYGALDAVDTPAVGSGDPTAGAEPLLAKIATIGRLLGHRPIGGNRIKPSRVISPSRRALVAIGASAGGPAALATLLAALPQEFPAALVIIQHVDERFAEGMADWLAEHSALPIRLAKENDPLVNGTVLLAGTSDHLILKGGDRVGYTSEPRSYAYRPSVDVFFRSVGELWRGRAVGVLLTGMGADGAEGLKTLRESGHHTIAQDRATSAVYGMPKAAAAMNAAVEILSLQQIAPRLADVMTRPAQGAVA